MAEETIASSGWAPTDAEPLEGGRIRMLEPGVKCVLDPFTVGGLVEMRSGGPAMTVRMIISDSVHVEWFLDGKLQFAAFPRQMLQASDGGDLQGRGRELDRLIDDLHRQWLRLTAEPSPSQPVIPTLVVGFAGGMLTAALFGWLQ